MTDAQLDDHAVGMIWAQDDAGAIGREGRMPWHLPEDLRHFAITTRGACVIMGRRTWESLPPESKPLPGRSNIVLSTESEFRAPGATVVSSLPAALLAAGSNDVWIIGGARVFREALDLDEVRRALVTKIETHAVDADTFAPDLDGDKRWELAASSPWRRSQSGLRYRFCSYRRARTADAATPSAVPTAAGTAHPKPTS